ncbi:MAG: type II secretion system GspH family protein [Oscillospiraceae bacterium]|nr:type II secretion system GspH family protein [Oscillospiraceae bacterium]
MVLNQTAQRNTVSDRGNGNSAGFAGSKVKGFTLLELIIVIGILGVLMSISSWAITGFMRTSQRQAFQGAAQQGLSAIQNCLINWEINPSLEADVTGGASADRVILSFIVTDGMIHINSAASPLTNRIAVRLNGGSAEVLVVTTERYASLARQIQDNIGAGVNGRFDVYFNLQRDAYAINGVTRDRSFTVERVVYSPDTNGPVINGQANIGNLLRVGGTTAFYANQPGHMIDFRANVDKYGSYPYTDDIA